MAPMRCLCALHATQRCRSADDYIAIKFVQPLEKCDISRPRRFTMSTDILCTRRCGWQVVFYCYLPHKCTAAVASKLRKIRPKFDGNPLPKTQPMLLLTSIGGYTIALVVLPTRVQTFLGLYQYKWDAKICNYANGGGNILLLVGEAYPSHEKMFYAAFHPLLLLGMMDWCCQIGTLIIQDQSNGENELFYPTRNNYFIPHVSNMYIHFKYYHITSA